MVYITGDLHADTAAKGLQEYLAKCTENDWLIVLGDTNLYFGEHNKAFTDWFCSLRAKIAFLDGNHENFDWLEGLPEEEWCGGRGHRVTENILHLMRGYVFQIEGLRLLIMGGCESTQKWKDLGPWWARENPTGEEIRRAYQNLAAEDNCVDFVLTHKYAKVPLDPNADPYTLDGFMNHVNDKIEYRHWYCGHWHKDEPFDEKHTFVYKDLILLK